MNTEFKKGLTEQEVTDRRRKTGFNELTTEKENLFLKFLGYFKGPILYGVFCCVSSATRHANNRRSHGNCCSLGRRST